MEHIGCTCGSNDDMRCEICFIFCEIDEISIDGNITRERMIMKNTFNKINSSEKFVIHYKNESCNILITNYGTIFGSTQRNFSQGNRQGGYRKFEIELSNYLIKKIKQKMSTGPNLDFSMITNYILD